MRFLLVSFILTPSLLQAQRIKAFFGLFEGTGSGAYPYSGLYYGQENPSTGALTSGVYPLTGIDAFGNDLAYDPQTKLLFVVGGLSSTSTSGSVYALDVWHSLVPLAGGLMGIEARRAVVKDTLLLVTRNRDPFFTAYRIRYNAQQGLLQLDSLWSFPVHPLRRSVPEALLVKGDTAYLALSYDPMNPLTGKDSFVVALDLRTRQVVGSWETPSNPTELVQIGSALYAACYGDYSGHLRIARIVPSSSSVTVWDAGYTSYGGFATDTGGVKDTILFWASDNTLRAFSVTTGQTTPTAYLGLASSGFPFLPYGLLWVGQNLHMSFTNFTDTSLIVFRDPSWWPTPPYLDTAFVSMGMGGIGYPSLRRFLYVEDDTSRVTTALPTTDLRVRIGPVPATSWLFWEAPFDVGSLSLWDRQGHCVRRFSPQEKQLFVGDLPAGLYLLHFTSAEGDRQWSYRIIKE